MLLKFSALPWPYPKSIIKLHLYAKIDRLHQNIWYRHTRPSACSSMCPSCGMDLIFTALHGMPARTSYEKAVCPSVRLSVRLSNACTVTKRIEERSSWFLYHTKYHLAWIFENKNGWWELPFYLKLWVKLIYGEIEIADFQSIFARSAPAVVLSKNVPLTLIGSPLRAFQWA